MHGRYAFNSPLSITEFTDYTDYLCNASTMPIVIASSIILNPGRVHSFVFNYLQQRYNAATCVALHQQLLFICLDCLGQSSKMLVLVAEVGGQGDRDLSVCQLKDDIVSIKVIEKQFTQKCFLGKIKSQVLEFFLR